MSFCTSPSFVQRLYSEAIQLFHLNSWSFRYVHALELVNEAAFAAVVLGQRLTGI
jgi:hypothetical protein